MDPAAAFAKQLMPWTDQDQQESMSARANQPTPVMKQKGEPSKLATVNWKGLASASDSLVIYMGLHNLAYIVEELIAGGLDPATPAAVIQQGTVAGQRCLKAPLQQLAHQVHSQGLAAPSIVVVGAVVDEQVAACAPQPAEAVMPISIESSSSSVQ